MKTLVIFFTVACLGVVFTLSPPFGRSTHVTPDMDPSHQTHLMNAEQRLRESKLKEAPDHTIQLCGARLLQFVKRVCKNFYAPNEQHTPTTFDPFERSDQPARLPRQIVQDCCHAPCSIPHLMKYCGTDIDEIEPMIIPPYMEPPLASVTTSAPRHPHPPIIENKPQHDGTFSSIEPLVLILPWNGDARRARPLPLLPHFAHANRHMTSHLKQVPTSDESNGSDMEGRSQESVVDYISDSEEEMEYARPWRYYPPSESVTIPPLQGLFARHLYGTNDESNYLQ